MRLLVSGATKVIRECLESTPELCHRYLGHLLVPGNFNRIETLLETGLPIAADNGCFKELDRGRYIRMLKLLRDTRCPVLWVTIPDVVGNASLTLVRFGMWLPVLRYYGLPVAFVAQDGQEELPTPWDDFECLFIGGTTDWKESRHAIKLVVEAKRRGKWVHVGRVNSERRERIFLPWGVDSIDGTQYSMFSRHYIPPALVRLAGYEKEMEKNNARTDVPGGNRGGEHAPGPVRPGDGHSERAHLHRAGPVEP